jgi:uncharacterized protein YhbP (UPF0306 family)
MKRTAPAVATSQAEEEVPAILLGAAMPDDHPEIETAACMECHTILTDGVTTATQRFLERPGAIENQALWQEIAAFFGERQSCVIATSINNDPYVTTVDFALDPVNQVMYALSEKGTRKLDQIKMNPKVAVEYHQPRDWQTKIFRCLQMRGEARTFSADDPQFAEGLRIFNPQIDEEMIRRGMDMTCFTPKEILFYDNLRKAKGLNIFQIWKR